MLTLENQIGRQEDWANYVTNVEMRDTPMLDWLPEGSRQKDMLYSYQADKFATPVDNSHVDGQPWTNFLSAGDSRARLRSLGQWFTKTTSVSKLAQDVTDVAGIADEMARDIPKRLKEMATDAEAAFGEDYDCREDNAVVGYRTRGIGSWIKATAQALYPVPTAFLTPAASIDATAIASLTENNVRTVLASIWNTIKSRDKITAFMGPTTKQKFSDFQFYLPTSASTQATGVIFNQDGGDREVIRAVDKYSSDFGPLDLVLTPWLAAIQNSGSTTVSQGRCYFMHRKMWERRWAQQPRVYKLPFEGGSYQAAMDQILMLVCKNPQGEGKLAPT